MTTRLRSGAVTSLALGVVLAAASVLLGAGAAQAAPQSLPVQVSFADLMPGDVRSASWQVHVETRARVATAVLHREGSGVLWTALLCPTTGAGACLDVLTIGPGTRIAAGEYVMSIGAAVTGDLQPGQTRTLDAHYTLVQDDDGVLADTSGGRPSGHARTLAATGASALPLAATAAAATALGVLLVVLARRRRHDEPRGDTGAEARS